MGAAVSVDSIEDWASTLSVVWGKITNAYCKKDYILQLYRATIFKNPIGLYPLFLLENPSEKELELFSKYEKCKENLRIINKNVTKEAHGHTYYRDRLHDVIEAIDFNG